MITVTKSYRNLPAAHRQPKHQGHCSLIHGHNWGFDITFACRELDENGFVVDVGRLALVKQWLEEHFDHTLLLNQDDPHVTYLHASLAKVGLLLAKVVLVPNCGMEGLAKYVAAQLNNNLKELLHANDVGRGVRIEAVTCYEDEKNRATYVCNNLLP